MRLSLPRPCRSAAPDAAGNGAAATVLDEGALARLRELDPGGSRGFVVQVLRTFEGALQRHLDRLAAIDVALPDAKLAAEVAHTLKSSSASVGALVFSERCARLERVAKGGINGDIVPALEAVRTEGERVLSAVRAMLLK